ncbi:7126_t:CDS:2, partial [Scutellospora calospora]
MEPYQVELYTHYRLVAKLNERSVILFNVCKYITQFLQECQSNNEFISWKQSTTSILSADIHRFSDKKIEQAQSHLSKKQQYTKVFELAKTLENKQSHNSELGNEIIQQSSLSQIIVKNPVLKPERGTLEEHNIFYLVLKIESDDSISSELEGNSDDLITKQYSKRTDYNDSESENDNKNLASKNLKRTQHSKINKESLVYLDTRSV